MSFQDRFSAAPTQDKAYLGDEPVGPQLKKRLAGAAERANYTFTLPSGQEVEASFDPGTTQEQALAAFSRKYAQERQSHERVIGGGLLKGAAGFLDRLNLPAKLYSLAEAEFSDLSTPEKRAAAISRYRRHQDPLGSEMEERFPTPQDPLGRAEQGAAAALGDPMNYMGGWARSATLPLAQRVGSFAQHMLPSITGGISGEEGGLLTGDSFLGRTIGGILGSSTPRVVTRATERFRAPASRPPATPSGSSVGPPRPPPFGQPPGIGPGSFAKRFVGDIPAENVEPLKSLNERGIFPTAGDFFNSEILKGLQKYGDRLLGNKSYTREINRVDHEFTGAVLRGMGSEKPFVTAKDIIDTKNTLSNTYSKILPKIKVPFNFGKNHIGDKLTSITKEMYDQGNVDLKDHAILERLRDRMLDLFTTKTKGGKVVGEMRGDKFKIITSHGGALDRAIKSGTPEISYWASRMKDALDEHVFAAANRPGTRPGAGQRALHEQLLDTNKKYWTMMMVQEALAGPGKKTAKGIITPEEMRQVLTKGNRFTQYVQEKTDLHKLVRNAQAIISPQTAATGFETMDAHMIPKMLIGGGLVTGHPWLAAAGATYQGLSGRFVNSRMFQDWLTNQRTSRVLQNMMSMREAAARGAFTANERKREPTKIGTITPSRYGGTSE